MAAGSTYTPIATNTVTSNVTSYTFTSIPTTYTDLRLILSGILTNNDNITIRVGNGSVDTGTNYSSTYLGGSGSAASSGRFTSTSVAYLGYIGTGIAKYDFMNYSNTTTYKSILCRSDAASIWVEASVGLWRSTAAINTIRVGIDGVQSFTSGTTFTLYGIAAA